MRLLPAPLAWRLAALALAAAPAHAQTGLARVRGVVLPRSETAFAGLGQWDGASDSARVATVTLTPLRTLACTARPETGCVPFTAAAMGLYGRYGPVPLSMGEYRMEVTAPGCAVFTGPLVVLSDSESVVHVALTCGRP